MARAVVCSSGRNATDDDEEHRRPEDGDLAVGVGAERPGGEDVEGVRQDAREGHREREEACAGRSRRRSATRAGLGRRCDGGGLRHVDIGPDVAPRTSG